ncbi:DNA cytosine methyltransferase [Okeania sp.]|uniref:DNA cytosine methyltransferase n=1 Tax=Okeania sp. TaxID=3100323 RepID=UPI002B4AB453|nr:DNA cytosine methyltransferase [Okeania sp.]MEB3342043.1 DNA cytosine methyltransferase [Okeania sp.]
MTQTNKLKAIELFAGIGGFRLGMKAANIDTIWANNINKLSCQVYQSNFSNSSIVLDNINQINSSEIPEHDILTARFPCQPFSQAGYFSYQLSVKLRLKSEASNTDFSGTVLNIFSSPFKRRL